MRIKTVRRKERRRYPLPEISGDKWDIKQDRMGMVNKETKLMLVPLDASIESEFVRAHEVAHAKFSPAVPNPDELEGIDIGLLKAIEDYRIHRIMKAADLVYEFDDEITGRYRAVETPADVIGLYACTVHSPYEKVALSSIAEAKHPDKEGSVLHRTKKILEKYFGRPTESDRREGARIFNFSNTLEATRELTTFISHAEHIEAMLRADESLPEEILKDELRELMEFDSRGMDEEPEIYWGDMNILVYPMPIRCKNYLVHANVPVDEGVLMHDISRWSLDGRIFSRKKSVFGCSILIDISGSMALSRKDIYDVIEKAPHAKIMTYSANSERGTLRIIADKGKRVYDADIGATDGHCNVIDYPALQFLAQQRAPRIWVSDGIVTGIGDRTNKKLTLQCKEFALTNGIKRVRTVKKALDILDYIKYNCSPRALQRLSVGSAWSVEDED